MCILYTYTYALYMCIQYIYIHIHVCIIQHTSLKSSQIGYTSQNVNNATQTEQWSEILLKVCSRSLPLWQCSIYKHIFTIKVSLSWLG